ncbi:MAG: tetratricopeptide repeat protein [Bacteroidota bacterium]
MRRYCFCFITILLQVITSFAQEKDAALIALEQNFAKAASDSLKVDACIALGRYYIPRDFNRVDSILKAAKEIVATATYDTRDHKARILRQTGILFNKRSNSPQALSSYLAAKKIAENLKDSIQISNDYSNIGSLYYRQKEYPKAILNYKKAAEINDKINEYQSLGRNYRLIALVYSYEENIDSTAFYVEKAKEVFTKINDTPWLTELKYIEAKVTVFQGEYLKGMTLLQSYLAYVLQENKVNKIINTHQLLAEIYLNLQQYPAALKSINDALRIANKNDIKSSQVKAYKTRSDIFRKMNKANLALADYDMYTLLSTNVLNADKIRKVKEVELNAAFEKKQLLDSLKFEEERKVLLLETENEALQKKWYLALLVMLLFAVAMILYFGNNYFKKLKLRKQVQAQKLNSKIDQLSTEISTKKEEISELMAETIIHLNAKEKITENLNKLSKQEEGISLTGIIAELKADKLEDSKLVLLKENIETLNYEFLKRLREKHPNLTKTDVEVCSFIKLGLSRKEISELRKTGLDAIKSTRFRLKKKLELTAEDSLDEYVKNL